MQPPYTGPDTTTSLRVLRELAASGLPEPAMLLGGWAVYFLVQETWKTSFGEDYFGSRDIDLGFLTPADASLADLKAGNMPATVRFLVDTHKFVPHGMYQLARFHAWDTNVVLTEEQVKRMAPHEYYAILVDLVASHQRPDLRDVAGFQPFSEPLLELPFGNPMHRSEVALEGASLMVPAPHVLIGMKLRSLPQRTKDDKSIKDLCDLYALITGSGVGAKTLRSRLHRALPDAAEAVAKAEASSFLVDAARHIDQDPDILATAIAQLR